MSAVGHCGDNAACEGFFGIANSQSKCNTRRGYENEGVNWNTEISLSAKKERDLMSYVQLTPGERYMLGQLLKQGPSVPKIAEQMGRHRTTIWREVRRNVRGNDPLYRWYEAQERCNGRRSRSRRNRRLSEEDLVLIEQCLARKLSPEQIANRGRLLLALDVSHETIYRHVWRDKQHGGQLFRHLRLSQKQKRKRYGAYDSRGRLAGKRPISERPEAANRRSEFGHWETDTVMGSPDQHCIVTLVERSTGYVLVGKLKDRSAEGLTRQVIEMIQREREGSFKTITSDNGTEFHSYKEIEQATGALFYFATPHHAWERGTCENTNGLIRQYLPKRVSMARITQERCDFVANELNIRPRKRHQYFTPKEMRYAA
jgi:transposase, IS30 family